MKRAFRRPQPAPLIRPAIPLRQGYAGTNPADECGRASFISMVCSGASMTAAHVPERPRNSAFA